MSEGQFDETFDFVAVGSGGGGMCSALFMRSIGKSVVVLEKSHLIGGTTSRSGGVMWIPNNRFMHEAGIEDSYEKSMAYMEATAGQSVNAPGTTPAKRSAYVTEATRMVDFLVSQGIKLRRAPSWPDYYDDRPGGSVPGRTVVADLFDTRELGEWREKLEPNFMVIPAYQAEGFEIALMRHSLIGKLTMFKVGLRIVWAKLTGKKWTSSGGALQGRMMQACIKAGAELRPSSPVRQIIIEDGRATGVVAEIDGRERRIAARLGVLINAGGFSHNQELRAKYQPSNSVRWTAATPGSTGDMHIEFMRIGAAMGQMEESVGNQMSIPPGGENKGNGVELSAVGGQMNITKPHSFVVDQSGVRYMNEAGSYMEFCQNMIARNHEVPAIPSWWIVDQKYMDDYMYTGTMPGTKKPQAWFDSGFLKRADTIEELAGLIDVEPAVLRATVDRFNDSARAGKDEQFGRGNRAYDNWLGNFHREGSHTLGPVEKAPFYAAPLVPGDVGTYGGVVTDEYARVLREDGSVIGGLYASGVSTASVMGRCYPGAGASVGPSFTFGYIAAKHAGNADNIA